MRCGFPDKLRIFKSADYTYTSEVYSNLGGKEGQGGSVWEGYGGHGV